MGGMRERGIGRRAAMAVLAAYALLLQSFLVAAAPAARLRPDGVVCLHGRADGPAPAGAPDEAAHGTCCTAACPGAPLASPPRAFVNASPPPRAVRAVAFAPPAAAPSAVLARDAPVARGPPAA